MQARQDASYIRRAIELAALDAVALHRPLKVELLAVELVRHALVADAARGPPGPAAAAEPPAAQKEEDDGRRAEGQCRDREDRPVAVGQVDADLPGHRSLCCVAPRPVRPPARALGRSPEPYMAYRCDAASPVSGA